MSPEIPRIVNFIVFLGVLYYFLRQPTAQFFRDRAGRIGHEFEQARIAREKAKAQLQEIESRLHRLDDEIQELQTRATAEAEAEEARIRAAAQTDIEKLRALARRDIESATNVARLELKTFAATQAVELAKGIIQREIRDEDHHRLVQQFNEQLEEAR
jgi:F-type H+-transporting ATPase subunit b